jgi:hypothetical protein
LERAVPIDADMIMTTDFILRTYPASLYADRSLGSINHIEGIVIHEGSAKKKTASLAFHVLQKFFFCFLFLSIFTPSLFTPAFRLEEA